LPYPQPLTLGFSISLGVLLRARARGFSVGIKSEVTFQKRRRSGVFRGFGLQFHTSSVLRIISVIIPALLLTWGG
jgi:hypothetical protein